jgi:hypothetical protein
MTVIIAGADHQCLPARIITLYPQISALAPRPAAEASERATTKFYLRG